MIEITRKKSNLVLREIYFADSAVPTDQQRDMDIYIQCASYITDCYDFFTVVNTLDDDSETIFSRFSKNHRYEIRRAMEKDKVSVVVNFTPDESDIEAFTNFYNDFARFRGVAVSNRVKLSALAQKNALILSCASDLTSGLPLAMHCYVSDGKRARLYYSGTLPRKDDSCFDNQLVGRANKLLHWQAMLGMKDKGLAEYDFGGVANTAELKGIDDFKRQFGGSEITEYNTVIPVSLLGHTAIWLKKLLKR